MILIKYVNTTQQLVDILTEGLFTCDRWTTDDTNGERHDFTPQLLKAICQFLLQL